MKRLLVLFVFQFFLISNLYSQVSFAPVDTLEYTSAGSNTYHVGNTFSIDFNKDGFDDILILKGNSIFLKRNKGDGTFDNETLVYSANDHIYSISNFVDINNDNNLDLVISTSKGLNVLLGSNDQYVKVHESNDIATYGRLILFDSNKDGKIDLAFSKDNMIIICSNIINSLTTKSTFYTDDDGVIYDFEIKDINLDNHLDLVISGYVTKFKVLFGAASLTFTGIYSKQLASLALFEIGDLNLDGYPDITYLEKNNNLFTLIYNNVTNTYSQNAVFLNGPLPANMFSFKLVDIKNNGTLDLIYNRFYSLVFRENNGLGQFLPEQTILNSNQMLPYTFNLIHFDDNEVDDILMSDYNKYQIISFNNDGLLQDNITDSYLADFTDILFEDMDGDGFSDIISVSRTGNLQVRWGNISYDYSEYSEYPIPLDSFYGAITDVNEDGKLDVLVTVRSNTNLINKIVLITNAGNREFEQSRDWKYFPSADKPNVVDIDNNGIADVLVYQIFGNKIAWLDVENENFNEYFQTERTFEIDGEGIENLTYDDVNNDGYIDLFTANFTTKNVSILKNNQTGGFVETTLVPNGVVSGVHGVRAFDYNNDQHKDLLIIVAHSSSYALQVFLNDQQGNFTFHTSRTLTEMYQPEHIDVLDIDGDLDQDFIVSPWDYQTTNVFINQNGDFVNVGSEMIKNTGQASRIYKDLNADGKPDVYSGTLTYGKTFIQLNNSVLEPYPVETEISITEIGLKNVKIDLGLSNESGRLVIITKGDELSTVPVDNQFYSANLQYGIGAAFANNAYVVHAGKETSLEVTGLSTSSQYLITVFEYNVNYPQTTIINYSTDKVQRKILTLNSPPQIAAVPAQTGSNLQPVYVTLNITDEDNLINEFTYEFFSSNEDVVSPNNISVATTNTNAILEIIASSEGETSIELIVRDTANNSATLIIDFTSLIVGIEEASASNMSVFPNPFRSVIQISHNNRNQALMIYNGTGQLITKFDSIPESLDMSLFVPGFYLFKTFHGESFKATKY